jgi:NAD(P)-dependent dehydrogenase (short-subunit alcohol dehydrogenase family)
MTGDSTTLAGRAALVTGGGSGIGLGCAQAFAAVGATVTICGRTRSRLDEAAATILDTAGSGAEVQVAVCDVTDEAQVQAAVASASEPTGALDVVLASAGGSSTYGPLTQVDAEAFRETMDLNVLGTFLTLKHATPVMIESGGGSFIGISSIAGSRTHRWFGAYGPAKAAIEALVQNAADELGASGVRVNAIAPGLVETEMVEAITAGGPVLDDYLDQMPIARPGTVEDIAAAACYLAGDGAAWVTGQVLGVDGGHSLRRGPLFRGRAPRSGGALTPGPPPGDRPGSALEAVGYRRRGDR